MATGLLPSLATAFGEPAAFANGSGGVLLKFYDFDIYL
jgi:hypothetical protein